MKKLNLELLGNTFLINERNQAVKDTVELHSELQKENSQLGLKWIVEAVSDYNRGRGYNSFKYNITDAMKSIDAYYWQKLYDTIDYKGCVTSGEYAKARKSVEAKETSEFNLSNLNDLIKNIEQNFEANVTKKVCELFKNISGYKPKPNPKGFAKTIIFSTESYAKTDKFDELLHNMAVVLGVNSDRYLQANVSLTYSIKITDEWVSFYNGLFQVKLHSNTCHVKVNPIVAKLLNDELHKSDEYAIDAKFLTSEGDKKFDTSGEILFNTNSSLLISFSRTREPVKSFRIPYDIDDNVTNQLHEVVKLMGGEVVKGEAIFDEDISDKAFIIGCNKMI